MKLIEQQKPKETTYDNHKEKFNKRMESIKSVVFVKPKKLIKKIAIDFGDDGFYTYSSNNSNDSNDSDYNDNEDEYDDEEFNNLEKCAGW